MVLGKNLSRLIFGDAGNGVTKVASLDPKNIAKGLEKVAGLPLNPSTYPDLMGMLKIASQCINTMDAEIHNFEKKAEVRVIIDDLVNNGITDEFDVEEKIASLMSKNGQELDTVKEAIKLSSIMADGKLFDDFEKSAGSSQKNMFDGIL